MESDEFDKKALVSTTDNVDAQCSVPVNSVILDYYKKFGRKRDLEQFFSLSTAQGDIRDTSGLFWRKMKSENDSSDSGGRKSEPSAHELCRISIRCSMPDSSQSDDPKTKTESPQTVSPPIIIEELPSNISRETDNDSIRSDDNHSQKSYDPLLDLSAHKPLSPTSSITSQRKLEWDSLADVGYANESDRKTSASSLSTLERLALKQQYSNNDSQNIGPPTCHSTPVDENETKSKSRKGAGRKMTKIIKKDVDFVEVNVPHTSNTNPPQAINVNLTKHISFNVEKDGGITFGNVRKDINVSPEKTETDGSSKVGVNKEIQTSLPKTKDKSSSSVEEPKPSTVKTQTIPVMISLNTLKKRLRRKKSRSIRRRLRTRRKTNDNNITPQEKSGEPLSDAESFEYMPGHIYNQNQMQANISNESRAHHSNAGNKSSLESSGGLTTDSSKESKHSLTKDLEKCIDVLKVTLQKRYDDGETKKKLITGIVQRLLNTKYRDDEAKTDFLSGMSFSSKNLNMKENNTTTSTSDANNTDDSKQKLPKKSILRMEKFNSKVLASTSQSTPNLFTASTETKTTNLTKMVTSHTESDESSRGKTSSDNAITKTSSEELYMKYLRALKREQTYKKHLKEKEEFLKQKLASSIKAIKAPKQHNANVNERLKELMKDLTRNNYDDGSGDASKLEGGSTQGHFNSDSNNEAGRSQRSHSVFTLSSSHSESQKKPNLKKKLQVDRDLDPSSSKKHYCCCTHHSSSPTARCADSSVQVNIQNQRDDAKHEQTECPNCQKSKKSSKNIQRIRANNMTLDMNVVECNDNECDQYIAPGNPNVIPPSVETCPKCLKNKIPVAPECEICEKIIRSPRHIPKDIPNKNIAEIKYVCVCKNKQTSSINTDSDLMIYKCSKLTNRGIQFEGPQNDGSCQFSEEDAIQMVKAPCHMNNGTNTSSSKGIATMSTSSDNSSNAKKRSQSSQTNLHVKMTMCSDYPISVGNASTKCHAGSEHGKNTIIHEATRCLQTEISIDPKISDPTLSDINIVANCAELVTEHRREVSKSNSKSSFSDVYTSSDTGKLVFRSGYTLFGGGIKDSDLNIFESTKSCSTPPEKTPDYTIPIEGTNLAVKVSVASMNIKDKNDQGVITERAPVMNQGTCIADECSRSAQCSHSSSTKSSKSNSSSIEHSNKKGSSCCEDSARRPSLRQTSPKPVLPNQTSPNNSCRQSSPKMEPHRRPSTRQESPSTRQVSPRPTSPKKSYLSRPIASHSPPRNTYPKTVQLKEKPLLRRANTDNGKLETSCTSSQNETQNKNSTPKNSCQRDFDWNKAAPKTSNRSSEDDYYSCKKEIGIQKDLSGDESSGRQCKPKMASKGVGGKIETPRHGCGVSCQTEDEDAVTEKKKTACDKCKCDNGCECDKKTVEKKLACSKCDCGDGCDCDKTESNPKNTKCGDCKCEDECKCDKDVENNPKKMSSKKCGCDGDCKCEHDSDCNGNKDPIMTLIQDITRRYSKTDMMKIKKKKCFTEIVTVLNYLLETDESTDLELKSEAPETSDKHSPRTQTSCNNNAKQFIPQTSKSPRKFVTNKCFRRSSPSPSREKNSKKNMKSKSPLSCDKKKHVLRQSESDSTPSKRNKGVQIKCASKCTDSSDVPCSTSDSAACRILNKIKKECEKYNLRRNKCGRKCEISSSTSVNCEDCKKVHTCGCRHRCKRSKTVDKLQKKCVAYNLILQTSESLLSEETTCEKARPLHSVVVKVPKRKDRLRSCQETIYEIEKGMRDKCSPRASRSKSCPRDSSDEFLRKAQECSVREYLEKNRPDFVEKCSERQSCLKYINEMRAQDSKNSPRLKMIVIHQPNCMGALGPKPNPCCGGVHKCFNPCDPCNPPDPCIPCNPNFQIQPCMPNPCDLQGLQAMNMVTKLASERAAQRDLLSLHVDRQPDLTALNTEELQQLAQQIGMDLRRKNTAPKIISERAMKKHSEKIYKTLPEVTQKKEEKRKENIKKTNLLMANIFKKNLQKKTLGGSVNISNYSSVIKI